MHAADGRIWGAIVKSSIVQKWMRGTHNWYEACLWFLCKIYLFSTQKKYTVRALLFLMCASKKYFSPPPPSSITTPPPTPPQIDHEPHHVRTNPKPQHSEKAKAKRSVREDWASKTHIKFRYRESNPGLPGSKEFESNQSFWKRVMLTPTLYRKYWVPIVRLFGVE